MKYLNVTAARASLLALVDSGLEERVAITKNGQPVAVLLDFDDYRSLRATQILASNPEEMAKVNAMVDRVHASASDPTLDGASATLPKVVAQVEREIIKHTLLARKRRKDEGFKGTALRRRDSLKAKG